MIHLPLFLALMSVGEVLVPWTVRLAVVSYVASLTLRLVSKDQGKRLAWSRYLWTAGDVFFVFHVGCAFHYVHHWSHLAAFQTTARRTLETVGFEFGYGIYANHLFLLIWGVDVLSWWTWGDARYCRRGRLWESLVQGYLAFIFLNGTILFGSPASVPLGLLGCAVLGWTSFRRDQESGTM